MRTMQVQTRMQKKHDATVAHPGWFKCVFRLSTFDLDSRGDFIERRHKAAGGLDLHMGWGELFFPVVRAYAVPMTRGFRRGRAISKSSKIRDAAPEIANSDLLNILRGKFQLFCVVMQTRDAFYDSYW